MQGLLIRLGYAWIITLIPWLIDAEGTYVFGEALMTDNFYFLALAPDSSPDLQAGFIRPEIAQLCT